MQIDGKFPAVFRPGDREPAVYENGRLSVAPFRGSHAGILKADCTFIPLRLIAFRQPLGILGCNELFDVGQIVFLQIVKVEEIVVVCDAYGDFLRHLRVCPAIGDAFHLSVRDPILRNLQRKAMAGISGRRSRPQCHCQKQSQRRAEYSPFRHNALHSAIRSFRLRENLPAEAPA